MQLFLLSIIQTRKLFLLFFRFPNLQFEYKDPEPRFDRNKVLHIKKKFSVINA